MTLDQLMMARTRSLLQSLALYVDDGDRIWTANQATADNNLTFETVVEEYHDQDDPEVSSVVAPGQSHDFSGLPPTLTSYNGAWDLVNASANVADSRGLIRADMAAMLTGEASAEFDAVFGSRIETTLDRMTDIQYPNATQRIGGRMPLPNVDDNPAWALGVDFDATGYSSKELSLYSTTGPFLYVDDDTRAFNVNSVKGHELLSEL